MAYLGSKIFCGWSLRGRPGAPNVGSSGLLNILLRCIVGELLWRFAMLPGMDISYTC